MSVAYTIAVAVTAPALAGLAWHGFRAGRRGALPFWIIALLALLALPIPDARWSFMALGMVWVLGFAWGARPQARIERGTRRERKRLARAIDRRELQFHYQPIVDQLSDVGPVAVSAEALVRWQQPNGKLVFPGPWLDTNQADPDLSCAFSDLLWEDAASVAALFPHLRISINTMPDKVAEEGWAEILLALIPQDVKPAQFTIEVLEGALLQDTPCVRHNLEVLHLAGFHIALDDFGSGNANMVTLMTFLDLVDTVKVDQLLIRHEDRRGAEAVIRLAKSFGKVVVAEGVETEEQASWLRSLDVHMVQGWIYAKAMPLAQFSAYVMKKGGFVSAD